MPKLLLVRHGETDWNLEKRFQGLTDTRLNETGIWQSEQVAETLQSAEIHHLHTSPLTRTRQTADIINQYHNLRPQPDERLRELGFGAWEGHTWAEIERNYPTHAAKYAQNMANVPPNAEPLPLYELRIQSFIESLRHTKGTHLIVSHGGTLRTLLCLLIGLSVLEHWQFNMANCSITNIDIYDQAAIVNYSNRTDHLKLCKDFSTNSPN